MSSPLKPVGMVVLVLGVWGFTVLKWGHTPPEPPYRADASTGASASPSSSAAPIASAPKGPRRPGRTPFGRPVDESDEDHQADLRRIREREAKKAPGSVERSMDDLKDSMLGKDDKTRGFDVRPPRDLPPKS